MAIKETVKRAGDGHPTLVLQIELEIDGDVIVTIENHDINGQGFPIGYQDRKSLSDPFARVEFCVSGGRSRRTHQALMILMKAMKEDNLNKPI
jgi:hypothetical protein